jgi:CBS domain-containing protein
MSASLRLVAAHGTATELWPRLREKPPYVGLDASAVCVMNDFRREVARTIDAGRRLDDALNELFRSGARTILVTSAQQVIGLVTVRDLRGESIAHSDYRAWRDSLRVADVMTNVSDMPTIDWQTVLDVTVGDLVEIFQGTGVECLVVIESESSARVRIRGLIHRGRLEQQLGTYAS